MGGVKTEKLSPDTSKRHIQTPHTPLTPASPRGQQQGYPKESSQMPKRSSHPAWQHAQECGYKATAAFILLLFYFKSSICPFSRCFRPPAPPRKAPFSPKLSLSVSRVSIMGLSGDTSLLKKVPKGGDFLPGKCHKVGFMSQPLLG